MGRAESASPGLLAALETTAGLTVRPGERLARHATFRIGGPAEYFVEAATAAGLSELLGAAAGSACPLHLLGLGSNVLFPDEGLEGVVLRLAGEFKEARIEGESVEAGGAMALALLAQRTARAGLSGLEALSGFPSTVGGAVVMNAGCYGTEIKDVLRHAEVVDRDGSRRLWTVEDLEPAYRTTRLQGGDAIVIGAVFDLERGNAAASLARIEELNAKRRASLPSGLPNAGSVFRNPPGDYAGRLVEECGLKGRRLGGARISPKHGNVIVNEDGALAGDVLGLMLEARAAVAERFGVTLEPEVVLTGSLAGRWREATAA